MKVVFKRCPKYDAPPQGDFQVVSLEWRPRNVIDIFSSGVPEVCMSNGVPGDVFFAAPEDNLQDNRFSFRVFDAGATAWFVNGTDPL